MFDTNSIDHSLRSLSVVDYEPRLVYESIFILQTKKVIYLKPYVTVQLLLLLSGDIERCPGPDFVNFTNARGIKIVHQNIRGLFHNFGDFCAVLEKYKNIDIITLSETHITHNDSELLFAIPGYTFVSKPRLNGPGGGVSVYISSKIKWQRRTDLESDNLEILCIEIIQKCAKNFLVGSLYRPPDSSIYLQANFNELFNNFLAKVNEVFSEVILLGDLNANYLVMNNSKELKSLIASNSFKQLIEAPTRITKDSSTLIDVILTSNRKNIAATVTTHLSLSDHDLVGCIRKLNNTKLKPRTITCRNYSGYDPLKLKRDLSSNVMEPLYAIKDVNEAWKYLRNVLTDCFDRHAPMITKRVKGSFSPWLSQEIKELMNKRDKALRKFRKKKSEVDWNTYKRLRNACTTEIRKARNNYHQTLLTENKSNPKKFWRTIKSIFPSKKSVSVSYESNKTKANSFCSFFSNIAKTLKEKSFPLREFVWKSPTFIPTQSLHTFQFTYVSKIFVEKEVRNLKRNKASGFDNLPPGLLKDVAAEIAGPIAHVINLSLRSGQVPADWKMALVIPLHKSGCTSDNNNYRPISVLPIVSKILEKAVHRQLIEYLERNNCLSQNQFGYRSQRSTDLATALFTDSIRKAADKGLLTGAVFLDLSKAFDTLDHSRLLEKLKSYGVKGLAYNWFSDYLFQRFQVVKLGQELSSPCPLMCGVPQGSILGPLLFLIFFNDFEGCLQYSKVIQFADDTVVYVSSNDVINIDGKLNHDMISIASYLECNDLVINLKKGKTESMLFGTAKRISTIPDESRFLKIYFNNSLINATSSYTYLGTVLDQHLGLGANFDKKYKRASSKLGVLRKLLPMLTLEAAFTLYLSVIVSALRYNCISQLDLNQSQQKKLRSLECRANFILKRKTTPIKNEIDTHAILLVHKCLNGEVCDSYKDYFKINEHRMNTRNNSALVKVPKVKLEIAKRGFFFMGAKLYNLLPRDIRECKDGFRKKVKLFFK